MPARFDGYLNAPGFSPVYETFENDFTFGRVWSHITSAAWVSGAARDAGMTPTTVLRSGLLLGQIAASGKLTNYSATATDGSQNVIGVLGTTINVLDLSAANADKFMHMVIGGPVQAARLYGLDNVARRQMRGRFILDDDIAQKIGGHALVEVAKTADYTVLASDAGTLFTTAGAAGAVNFTLPALSAGLGPFEFLAVANQNMTVTAPAGKLVTFNNAAATSVAFSTAGNKVGGRVRLACNAAGTFYYMENLSPGNTITVA